MLRYPYRLQTAWIASLVLAWLTLCSPWGGRWNALFAVLVTAGAVSIIVAMTRRLRQRQADVAQVLSAVDGPFEAFSDDLKRNTPVVLVVGDPATLMRAFSDDVVRVTDAAIWVRCDTTSLLKRHAAALKLWRDGQRPDAVLLLVAADQGDVEIPLATTLRQWRAAIDEAGRAVGAQLPAGIAIYAEEILDAQQACPWFGAAGSKPIEIGPLLGEITGRLWCYTQGASSADMEVRAHRAARLGALTKWSSHAVLSVLTDNQQDSGPLRILAFGVTAVPGAPVHASPFGQYVAVTTGLLYQPMSKQMDRSRSRYPLPNALIRGLPQPSFRRALPRALVHAFVGLAVFVMAGSVAAAWQNRDLAQRIAADTARYEATPSRPDEQKVTALQSIRRDRNELEHYALAGVPLRLDFGLYRGAIWLPVVDRLIASYRPPTSSVIDLDSMSLFKTGSAMLGPGTNRLLVQALEMVKAHPDKRVLVAGYTDNLGNPQANIKLSMARAQAVRDWLVDASGLPITRFAIQGYGDTRPKVSNDTASGRAVNRRVEITLIPDCRTDDSRSTLGHSACS